MDRRPESVVRQGGEAIGYVHDQGPGDGRDRNPVAIAVEDLQRRDVVLREDGEALIVLPRQWA